MKVVPLEALIRKVVVLQVIPQKNVLGDIISMNQALHPEKAAKEAA